MAGNGSRGEEFSRPAQPRYSFIAFHHAPAYPFPALLTLTAAATITGYLFANEPPPCQIPSPSPR